MCVCVCVCVRVCVCVCVCLCAYVHSYVCEHTYACIYAVTSLVHHVCTTYMYVRTYVDMHTYVCTYVHENMHAGNLSYTHIAMHL